MEFIKPYTSAEEMKKRSNESAQNFDKETITITKYGKTYNLYDAIQAAREDTEIYPTLEKYGNLQTMERDVQGIYADLSEAMSLQDLFIQDTKLNELFDNLPSKERNIFDNDFYKFKKDGLAYYEKKAQEELKAIEKERAAELERKNQPIKVTVVDKGDK